MLARKSLSKSVQVLHPARQSTRFRVAILHGARSRRYEGHDACAHESVCTLVAGVVVLLLVAACGGAEKPESAPAEGEASEATEAAISDLAPLGTQVVMLEAFRIDASLLPPPIG